MKSKVMFALYPTNLRDTWRRLRRSVLLSQFCKDGLFPAFQIWFHSGLVTESILLVHKKGSRVFFNINTHARLRTLVGRHGNSKSHFDFSWHINDLYLHSGKRKNELATRPDSNGGESLPRCRGPISPPFLIGVVCHHVELLRCWKHRQWPKL